MVDYVQTLRDAYVVGKLYADFIYDKAYDYLLSYKLVPAQDSPEWKLAEQEAVKYNLAIQYELNKGLKNVEGVELYPSDFEKREKLKILRIEILTKKFLVYKFIASGKPLNILYDAENANTDA